MYDGWYLMLFILRVQAIILWSLKPLVITVDREMLLQGRRILFESEGAK